MSTALLTEDTPGTEAALRALGSADIVVGIPSYREQDSIAHVVRQCDLGLLEHFPDHRAVILNVDNDSPDGTRDEFEGTETTTPTLYISTPPGVKGKGNNIWNLMCAADLLGGKAVLMVDGDLLSILPQWIAGLGEPVLDHGIDFLTPWYARNEYDGTITNHLCYPLVYGLLAHNVRQPIGGEFAMSGRFVRHVLRQDWPPQAHEYGIDIFLTVNAILGGFALGQSGLGAKEHKPSAPKLGPMFMQVVTVLFTLLSRNRDRWSQSGVVTEPPRFGEVMLDEPASLAVDYKGIRRSATESYERHRETLRHALRSETFDIVDPMLRSGRMWVGTACWMHVVYDMLHAFDASGGDAAIVSAFEPLFFARVATFFNETLDLPHRECEERIVQQAREFRRTRRLLFQRYETVEGPEKAATS